MAKRANKSAAVRQQKAKKVQEADTPEQALFRALNYFPTPPWAARAGAEILRQIDPTAQVIYESACGEGHMAEALKEYFPIVHASDIHAHGYGDVRDFLLSEEHPEGVDWVMTNPPFSHAAEFIKKGLRVARRGVGMLLRIAFLEGTERYSLLYEGENPLTLVAPFVERVSMVLGAYDPDAGLAMCHAWFFFQKRAPGAYRLIDAPLIRPIPPGTNARLYRVEDARRFAKLADAPLLDFVNT